MHMRSVQAKCSTRSMYSRPLPFEPKSQGPRPRNFGFVCLLGGHEEWLVLRRSRAHSMAIGSIQSASHGASLSARVRGSLLGMDIFDAVGFRGLLDGTPDTQAN